MPRFGCLFPGLLNAGQFFRYEIGGERHRKKVSGHTRVDLRQRQEGLARSTLALSPLHHGGREGSKQDFYVVFFSPARGEERLRDSSQDDGNEACFYRAYIAYVPHLVVSSPARGRRCFSSCSSESSSPGKGKVSLFSPKFPFLFLRSSVRESLLGPRFRVYIQIHL